MKTPIAKLCLGLALLTVACGDKAKQAAQADSSLARDLALAGQQPAGTQTFQDTAVAPAPAKAAPSPKPEAPAPVHKKVAPRPRPEPPKAVAQAPQAQAPVVVPQPMAPVQAPAPAPLQGEIATGAAAVLTAGSKVCTSSNQPGDKLVATLNAPLTGSNGEGDSCRLDGRSRGGVGSPRIERRAA